MIPGTLAASGPVDEVAIADAKPAIADKKVAIADK